MIQIQNLNKKFLGAKKSIIDNFNLKIKDKDFVVIVGPSGCGKSTLLRMIAGLEEVTDGEILFDEKPVSRLEPSDRSVSMVFQDYALYPHMTVFENLAFGLTLKKIHQDDISKKVLAAAEVLDLTPYLQRKPAELSGGQRQRVAMGRAIVKDAKIFLFDEPLSNLDAKLRSKMRGEIKKFHLDQKGTSIYVTHDQLEALTLADQLVVLRDGKIEQSGTPQEVFNSPANSFVGEFIGTPSMNLIEVSVEYQTDGVYILGPDKAFNFKLPTNKTLFHTEKKLSPEKVILGIRPTDVVLHHAESAGWNAAFKIIYHELLGHEISMVLKCGSKEITSLMPAMLSEIKNSTTEFYFKLHFAHIFDAQSGKNINL